MSVNQLMLAKLLSGFSLAEIDHMKVKGWLDSRGCSALHQAVTGDYN